MRRRKLVGLVRLLAGTIAGALLGALVAPWLAQRFSPPVPLARDQWSLLVPNRVVPGKNGARTGSEGTGVVDGSLYIASRSFGRSDVIEPVLSTPVSRAVIALARGSGPIQVSFPTTDLFLGATVGISESGWWRRGSLDVHPLSLHGKTEIEARAGVMLVDGVPAGAATAGDVEFLGSAPAAKIASLAFYDADGGLIREHEFAKQPVSATARAIAAAFGSIVAIGVSLVVRGAGSPAAAVTWAVIASVPMLASIIPSYSTWADLQEHLCLTQSFPSELRLWAIATALGFFLLVSVTVSGLLSLKETVRRDLPLAAAASIILGISVAASLDLSWPGVLWSLPGLCFLALPIITAKRSGQPLLLVMIRDAPALSAIAVLGWSGGIGIAWCWRLATLLSDVSVLLARNPRAGTDAFLTLVIAFPLIAETSVRNTYLATAWSQETLRGASVGRKDGKVSTFAPYWQSGCRPGQPASSLYYFGGSSTGGAFQFSGHPEWTWPAQVEQRLCADPTVAGAIKSHNYGEGGRDSFDAATAAASLFDKELPSVVVYYGGVNDILTETSSLTRKQVATLAGDRPGAVGIVGRVSAASRLFSGFGLVFRPKSGSNAAVSAVPVADAEENLRTLAAATAATGGHLVLVPEYTAFELDGNMTPYWEMEARIAAELPAVTFVNLYEIIPSNQRESLLADRNHLTQAGSERVADVIAPVIGDILRQHSKIP